MQFATLQIDRNTEGFSGKRFYEEKRNAHWGTIPQAGPSSRYYQTDSGYKHNNCTELTCRFVLDFAFRPVSYPSHRSWISNVKSKFVFHENSISRSKHEVKGCQSVCFCKVLNEITLSSSDSQCQLHSQTSNHIKENFKPI